MVDDKVAFLTLGEQARLLRNRDLSPVELVELYLSRIGRLNSRLNSYITVCGEQALASARQSEREIRAGNYKGGLHGIPIAVKDQMWIQGVHTTGGSRLFPDFISDTDATLVANIKRAGGILLGTLNTMPFHMGTPIEYPYGTPKNPWNLERTPGGSSSGSGSSVAAGLCSGAVGEDTGGSIRGPASMCGITGLKATWSRISRHGVFTLCYPMDCAGPLARSAEDCAILLRAMAGWDPKDPTSSREPVPDYTAQLDGDLHHVRVGIVKEMLEDGTVGEETRHAVERAIEVLIELGATVQRVSLPLLYEGQAVHTAVVDTEAASYHRERLLTSYLKYEYNTRVRLMVGALLPSGMQTLATRVRASIGKQVLDTFENFDILVGATSANPAEVIPTETGIFSKEDAMEKLFKRSGRVGTTAFNMAGTPAASIPCGFSKDGLPLGFHIAGRRFEEGVILKVADAYQRVTDWHRKRPTFA